MINFIANYVCNNRLDVQNTIINQSKMMKKILPLLLALATATCAEGQTVSFSVPIAPCNNNGVLSATMTGFTPPLTVIWTTEGTTSTTIVHTVTGLSDALTGYSGGPISVTVNDGTSTATNTFAGSPPFTYSLSSTESICPMPGTVTGLATGGTAPYIYQWYNIGTGSAVATGATVTLPTGQYGVMITDAAGCKYGSKVNPDTATILYTSFTASVTATDANCTDGTASVASVSPSAVMPVSYRWSNGATTPNISGLTTGNYTVEIIDAAGCRATTDTAALYNPYSVFVNQTTVISLPLTSTPATCLGTDGSISTFVSGGAAPYTYNWSNGANTASQAGVPSGLYHVTVTDANGCTGNNSVFLGSSSTISVTTSSSPSLCTSPTGNATVIPAGGTPPYTISWYTTPAQTSTTATLLAPGNYNYRVSDATGCVLTGFVTVPPVNIINAITSSTSPICMAANGSISVSATGGAAPYTYLWNTGAATATLSSIPDGTYSVRVTDNMGCKATVPFELVSYSPVGVGISVTEASCLYVNDGTATATAYGGTAPYTYGWSTGGSTATISSLPTGLYQMTATDAVGCMTKRSVHVGYDAAETSCYCTIEGIVYNDTNSNCTQDAGDMGVANTQIYCSGIGYTYTDHNGHYSFMVPSGSYTVTETVSPNYSLAACQLNNLAVTASASAGCVLSANFANTATGAHNLRISTATLTPPVPGQTMVQQIVIANEGTVTEDSTYVTYKTDGQLFSPMFTPSSMFVGNPYYYTSTGIPSLAPGATQKITVAYKVPTNIAVGTSVAFRDTVGYNSPASTWADDYTPANNIRSHSDVVVASYSGNRKEVYPKGTGANGLIYNTDSVLEYTVHFQNIGSWYAQNVVIIDTIDNDLNWTTLHPVYESAPCKIMVYQSGAVKVAKFTFSNINMPPQAIDDLRSNGTFTYTIKTMPGLAVGTQFRNRASIYIDNYEPIVTNTTTNTLGSTAPGSVNNTATINHNSFAVYPNPANGTFTAAIHSGKSGSAAMSITDIAGKVLVTKTMLLQAGSNSITTDIHQLPAGVYIVNVNTGDKVTSQKLVVIR